MGFRLSPPEQFHLTIKFIGEWDEPRLVDLIEALRTLRFAAMQATLSVLEAVPSPRKPRVLAVGVEPRDELSALACRVDEALHGVGVPLERRGFRPHITTARQRAGRHAQATQVQALIERVGRLRASFRVDTLWLMHSRLSNVGAVHAGLWRWVAP